MTLGNMRQNGVRSLAVHCDLCHHEAVLEVEAWPDYVPVPAFRRRMVCTRCGIIGADARPNWKEQAPRPSLTGALRKYVRRSRPREKRPPPSLDHGTIASAHQTATARFCFRSSRNRVETFVFTMI